MNLQHNKGELKATRQTVIHTFTMPAFLLNIRAGFRPSPDCCDQVFAFIKRVH